MADPVFSVTEDHLADLMKSLKRLTSTEVMVGIPSDDEQPHLGGTGGTTKRVDTTITNAALGYIHEHGSPINNIPARPFLVPGVTGSQSQWEPYLEQAGKAAVEGDFAKLDKALNAAGITAVSAVKNRIISKIPPPLAPATVAARMAKRKSRKAKTAPDMTPLVDTGALLASISYVLRKKGKTP